jgi:hypothetical protein
MKGEPKVSQVFSGAGVDPNGLYPSRGLAAVYRGRQIVNLSPSIGILDGLTVIVPDLVKSGLRFVELGQ